MDFITIFSSNFVNLSLFIIFCKFCKLSFRPGSSGSGWSTWMIVSKKYMVNVAWTIKFLGNREMSRLFLILWNRARLWLVHSWHMFQLYLFYTCILGSTADLYIREEVKKEFAIWGGWGSHLPWSFFKKNSSFKQFWIIPWLPVRILHSCITTTAKCTGNHDFFWFLRWLWIWLDILLVGSQWSDQPKHVNFEVIMRN